MGKTPHPTPHTPHPVPTKNFWFFGLSYAIDGSYKGWNPYRERHWAIFVNCFLSKAN
ncbi:hypothetical protein C789_1622 [Microcystis aeruginosa FACHB-905 = DIANCHI905]|uniref:Uncharacterized protein n=1 Tax=Microcystis aeruginosa PCC 7806SL TaxID=1903187 RepID=A0AB33BU86_MICA7|nr:hypothetical protein BH695_4188 [Microcystis aeruginosa PCC 7806SL]ELS48574.1 hypothetical protein C789_1622 [Microcystis aeruginosa FACHB-905 = DIANCHI905]